MIFVGINSSGFPHYGNYTSLIKPIINIKKKIFFLADLHSFCKSIKFNNLLINKLVLISVFYSYFNNNIYFYQSYNKNILFFYWIISCFYNKKKIKEFHFYKKKKFLSIAKISYPILMISDIILSKNKYFFLGYDQIQHIEILKKIKKKLKKNFFKNNFIINNNIIYSYDKKKMSKTNKNDIFIYSNYKEIKLFINKFKFTLKKKKSLLDFYIKLFNKNYNFFFKKSFFHFKKIIIEKIYWNFFNKKKKFFYLLNNLDNLIKIINFGNNFSTKFISNNLLFLKKDYNL